MFNLSLLLNSDIMPEVSGAWASFFTGIGGFFVWLGSAILKGIASLAYLICKLVMGLIDFMQYLVQKLAGIEVYMNMEKFDPESLKQSDIVFRFLFSDAVTKVLKSVMVVFIVLLIVFTIFAIIKNEYKAATTGDDKLDHRKSLYAAFKAIITVILVPIMLVMGIMGSNAILASIARAYNISGNLSLGGQIFVASAYDASLYRNYANNGVRKYTSNQVSFEMPGTWKMKETMNVTEDVLKNKTENGTEYVFVLNLNGNETETFTVNSAIEVITPNSYSNSKPFTGYMFTYDGSTYYLCKCDATSSYKYDSGNDAYYNPAYYYYIKYILGAYIVEQKPAHDSFIQDYFEDKGYNTTNIVNDSSESNKSIINNIIEVYNNFIGSWVWDKIFSIVGNKLTFGLIQEDQAYLSTKGFMIHELYEEDGGSFLVDAAYNTWSYNSIVATDLSNWGSQNVSLETYTETFTTLSDRQRVATVVRNSASWGKLHDGGVYGFHPLSVEYLAMADVMDFVLENGIALYYVNANNSNINYEKGGITSEFRYKNGEVATRSAGFDGFLVDYKDYGRVAYEVKDDVVSELDGATYIVCYYDNNINQYVPVVNGEKVYDSYGNSYSFSSGQYPSDYKGVVIARGMFKDSSQARATDPTYLTSAMVIGNKKTDFDSKVTTALQLDLLSSGVGYNYLSQLTYATSGDVEYYDTMTANDWKNTDGTWDYGNDTYYWNGENLIYCLNKEYSKIITSDATGEPATSLTTTEGGAGTTETKEFDPDDPNDIYSHMADILVNKIGISDDGVGVKSFEMYDSFNSNTRTFKIKRIGAGESDQVYNVAMTITYETKTTKIVCEDETTKNVTYYRYIITPKIEGTGAKVVWNNDKHKGFTYTENIAGTSFTRSNTLYMYKEGTMLYFSNENNDFSVTNYAQLAQIVKATLDLWDTNISLAPVGYSADTLNNKDDYISALKTDITSQLEDGNGKYSVVVSSRGKTGTVFDGYAGQRKYTLTFDFNKEDNNTISANANYPNTLTYVDSGIELTRKAIFGLEITSASDEIDKIKWGNYTNEDGQYTIAYNVLGDTLVSKDDSYGDVVYVYSNDTNYSKIYNSSNILKPFDEAQAAKVLNMMLKSFTAPSGYEYQFLLKASLNEQLSINVELKRELEKDDLPNLEDGQLKSIFLALVKTSTSEGTGTSGAGTSAKTGETTSTNSKDLVKCIYSLTFDFSAGAGNKYQEIINAKDNGHHYWKDNGAETDLVCKDVFILSVTPVEDNPMFNVSHVAPTYEDEKFYYQTDYKSTKDEFFYYGSQACMTDANLSTTAGNLADSFVKNVLKIDGASCEEISATYSGNVQFTPSTIGSLVVNFKVKVSLTGENKSNSVTVNTSEDESEFYYVDFSLVMSTHECTNPLSDDTETKYYLYKFDVDFNIYNTYYIYVGGEAVAESTSKESTSTVGGEAVAETNSKESTSTENIIISVEDLSYSGTDEYLLYEYADSSKNKTITVYQYIYKDYKQDNTYFHLFNAVVGNDSKVDDGKKFITGKMTSSATTQTTATGGDDNTFTPNFGIDENGKVVTDASDTQKNNARKLVFTTAKMRIIYMPDYTAIFDPSQFTKSDTGNSTEEGNSNENAMKIYDENVLDKDYYTYMIVDTQNRVQDTAYYYTLTFKRDATSIDWKNAKVYAYSTNGNESIKLTATDEMKEYIKSRFKMEVVDVDLHNYLDVTKTETDSGDYYKTFVVTNTARTIYYSSKNALDSLTGDNYNSDSPFDVKTMQQRLIEKAKNFNNNARTITLDYKKYDKAYDLGNMVEDISRIIDNPISVLCCRDNVTTRQLVADFHINLLSDTAGFKFTFRMPRFAFATKQKSDAGDDNIILSLTKGQFSMDYNFEGKIAMGNLYSVVDINFLILVFAIVLIFGILGKAVWGLVGRIYQITLLYLMMPVVASTLPIDDKGTRFESWKKQMITEVLSTYGVTIGLNFFFIMIPVIRESTQIFTDADFVNMSSTMKWFAGSPERLNYICYILFLLVAFTLLKTVPKMVQEFTGYNKDVIDSGAKLKADTMKTVQEASTKASNFITGKTAIDGAKKAWGKAKEIGAGMIPGKAIYDEYKKKKEGKDGDKKAAEEEAAEAKKKQNQQYAMEHAHETADAAKAKLEAAKEANNAQGGAAAGDAGTQNPANANTSGQNAAYADVAGTLDDAAKQAIVNEAVDKTGQMAEAAMGMAEAAMEAADAQFGKTHDYVADKEREEAELKAAEKAQRDYENSRIGKAEAAYNESLESGKGYDLLFKKDIEEWNKNHSNEQISTEKITRQKNESDADFAARKQKDFENRLKASHQKHLDRLYARKEDENVGIKHGVGHSIVRTVVGGRKTMWQKGKEARKLQLLEEEKNKLENDIKKDTMALKKGHYNKLTSESLVRQALSDDAYAIYQRRYQERMNDPNHQGGEATARQAALKSMRGEVNALNAQKGQHIKEIEDKYAKAEEKFTNDHKGWLYSLGSTINTTAIQPGLSKAKVPAKWLADKGHTFIAGHTEQDKESAREFLKEQQDKLAARELARIGEKKNLEKAVADSIKKRDDLKEKYKDESDLLKLMKDFDKSKLKASKQRLLDDNKDLLNKMGHTGTTLKDFENFKQSSYSTLVTDKARLGVELKSAEKDIKRSEGDLKKFNESLKDPQVQKSVKKAEQMLNGTHVRSVGVPVAAAKGAAKLGKWAGQGIWTGVKWTGRKAAGVGKAVADTAVDVAKTINNNPRVQRAKQRVKNEIDDITLKTRIKIAKIKASPEYKTATKVVKDAARLGKWAGQGVWTATKAVGKTAWTAAKTVVGLPVGLAKGVYNTGKKVVAWHNRVKGTFDGAAAYARTNKDSSRAATEAKYKSVQDLLGKTLEKKEKEQMKDIEKRLQDRINRLKGKDESKLLTKANALKAAEMERLLKGFKAGTLTDAEKKQIDKYLNFSAATTKAKLEETQKRASRNQATTLSRANQERLIQELNKNTKAKYTSILQKELKNMGFTPAQINAMISKYTKSTAKDYYSGMKQDINQLLRQKQAAMQQALKAGQQNAKLMTEIRQLNALVGKMRVADARYRRDLIKLNESNRKIGKQLKNKKSADALSASIKSQMTNPYTNNGNNGNNGRP